MATEALPAPDPSTDPQKVETPDMTAEEMAKILCSYKSEAEHARKAGLNPRDEIWNQNWDLYWGRYDWSKKAGWQSKIAMPEAQQAIDRFSAAMKEALVQSGSEWYEVEDLGDKEGDLKPHVRKFMEFLLTGCGRTSDGQPMAFPPVFEEIVKAGSMTVLATSVVWKIDPRTKRGYVAVDALDARSIWLDPQNRNLYRIRRITIDKHELVAMAKQQDSAGNSLYNLDEIMRLTAHIDDQARNERSTSTGLGNDGEVTSRKTITLHEFLCTILNHEGDAIAENALAVLANGEYVIRGPEPNPFWHQRDWIVTSPLITVPFSVYGKSYVENWSGVMQAFIEMTNLVLDASYTSAMKAYAMVPDLLEDPTEAEEGVHPNKVFQLQEGSQVKDFLAEIDLGSLPAEAVTVWQSLKDESREGQMMSDIMLGQIPQKGGITATEVAATSSSGSAFIKSIAESVEQRHLEQVLTLVYWTGLQHVDFTDPAVVRALGEETAQMFATQREAFRQHQIGFKVRGISAIIRRGQMLRQLLAALSVIASSEPMLQQFMQRYDVTKVMDKILALHGVDTEDMQLTQREIMLRGIVQQMQQVAGGGAAPADEPNSNGNQRGGATGINSALVAQPGAAE